MPTPSGLHRNGGAASFIHTYQPDVIGVLHGFDRLRLVGTLRTLYHPEVMQHYLRRSGVLWKDFKAFATGLTDLIRQHAVQLAQTHQRPVIYLLYSRTTKETFARQIAERDGVRNGLIALRPSCIPRRQPGKPNCEYQTTKRTFSRELNRGHF